MYSEPVKDYLEKYANNNIESLQDLNKTLFATINDQNVRSTIIQEFYVIRQTYKYFEGMRAGGSLQEAEAKLQVISYMSIIEYALDYYLQNEYKNSRRISEHTDIPKKLIPVEKSLNKEFVEILRAKIENAYAPQNEQINNKKYQVYAKFDDEILTKDENWRKVKFEAKIKMIQDILDDTDPKAKSNVHKRQKRKDERHKFFDELTRWFILGMMFIWPIKVDMVKVCSLITRKKRTEL